MKNRKIRHWSVGWSDWVTSVAELPEQLTIAGTRDGYILVLNWHGVVLYSEQISPTWIGAVQTVQWAGRDLIITGAKDGAIRVFEWLSRSAKLEVLADFQVGMAVRSIDIATQSDSKQLLFAFGSENRSAYIASLHVNRGVLSKSAPIQCRTNGWIRAVSFCRNPILDQTLLAAGSGDKHVHFFTLNGKELAPAYVGAKVHALLSDQMTGPVYAVSDAGGFHVLVPETSTTYLARECIKLSARPFALVFANPHNSQVLIACVDGSLHLYDSHLNEIVGCCSIDKRSIALGSSSRTGPIDILISTMDNRLTALGLSLVEVEPLREATKAHGLVRPFIPGNFSLFAECLFYGLKHAEIDVGIARFIQLPHCDNACPELCVLGTDQGQVLVLRLDQEVNCDAIVFSRTFEDCRVWSVYSYWVPDNRCVLRLAIGTSTNEILLFGLDFSQEDVVSEQLESIKLPDWPRELRGIDGDDVSHYMAACENGDIFHFPSGTVFNAGDRFRCLYARSSNSQLSVLAGSDDWRVTLYRDGNLVWSYKTLDRVRETRIINDLYLATSEDRFLYVLDASGRLKFAYKVPHRALCLEVLRAEEGTQYVVGCGDGYVYFIDDTGWLHDAYEYPDRIRDVAIHDETELVVAAETSKVFVGPLRRQFIDTYYVKGVSATLKAEIHSLLAGIEEKGLAALEQLAPEVPLVLLEFCTQWISPAASKLLLHLVDDCIQRIQEFGSIRANYVIAQAILEVGSCVDQIAASARMSSLVSEASSEYASHALVACVPIVSRRDESPAKIQMIEALVRNAPLVPEWVADQCARNLLQTSFSRLDDEGYFAFFSVTRLPASQFRSIFGSLRKMLRTGGHRSADEEGSHELLDLLHSLDSETVYGFQELEDRSYVHLRWIGQLVEVGRKKGAVAVVKMALQLLVDSGCGSRTQRCFTDLSDLLTLGLSSDAEPEVTAFRIASTSLSVHIESENPALTSKEFLIMTVIDTLLHRKAGV